VILVYDFFSNIFLAIALIEKQAEDPSSLGEGMNAVRFLINYYFRAALISYIFPTIYQ
jgi:hypothetical protein